DVVITASYLPEGGQINDDVLGLGRPLRVFYDLDTPVTLANMEKQGVPYLRAEQIPEFDLVLSFTGGKTLEELERTYGARMARPLYGCVDPDDYPRVEASTEFACELSYMGTYAPDRQQKVDELFLEAARRHPERQFLLAGSLYPWEWEWRWPANVRRIEHVAPHDHPRLYSSSRLTLNITRGEMARWGWCPSGRFFEAAACGTPLITDWLEGLDWFFDVVRDLRVVSRACSTCLCTSCSLWLATPESVLSTTIPGRCAQGNYCSTWKKPVPQVSLRASSHPSELRWCNDRHYPRGRRRTENPAPGLLKRTAACWSSGCGWLRTAQSRFRVPGGTHDCRRRRTDMHGHFGREGRHRQVLCRAELCSGNLLRCPAQTARTLRCAVSCRAVRARPRPGAHWAARYNLVS